MMLTPKKQALAMSALRDQLLAALAQHEREDHDGQRCISNAVSAVAYLAHSIGMNETHLFYFGNLLDDYNRRCRDSECPHGKESDDA